MERDKNLGTFAASARANAGKNTERFESARSLILIMVTWIYFPKSSRAPGLALEVVKAFKCAPGIDSAAQTNDSNFALKAVAPGLRYAGFVVGSGKKAEQKIRVPVLFGRDGKREKPFDADAYHEQLDSLSRWKRQPRRWSRERTTRSGVVSLPRMRDMFHERR
jgi:hypothetical protein